MKKSVVLLVVVALIMNVAFVSAKESKLEKKFVNANQEFAALLKPSSAVGELESDVLVKVRVFVTANREIVVLYTGTENKELSNYIKETLNYKKLSSDELVAGQNYVFNVKFKV
jgi:hypothetical protein